MAGAPPSEAEAARAARIGGARADFVANLGRRVAELRVSLAALEKEPGSPRLRDELRRRVHALAAGAKLLRFDGMATSLGEVARILERAASAGGIDEGDAQQLSFAFEQLPSLAWGEPTHAQRQTERPPAAPVLGDRLPLPRTALVVGPIGLADALTEPAGAAGEPGMDCERTGAVAGAVELARALAPDVAVIDADLAGAKELIEQLGDDPMTEPMPVVVVGSWASPEQAARFVALGVARALPKPVSPEALRRACAEVAVTDDAPAPPRPLGDATLDELGARLAEEIRRGLCDAAGSHQRGVSIPLGDGTEVLAAVWGAVARVRELVTIKSNGAVRFSGTGPEGALPIASWWDATRAASDRSASESRGQAPDRLDGKRVVVADDDPAVTWFLSGVLRAAGATVFEAKDGQRALEVACRVSPDLVITDVLMPNLDGFALCRALKRDVALRDVPVILLSWKEDLLQRVRELGADADGYLRKEASAATVVHRVGEVLRPKSRVEGRLRAGGEVRGRLDGLTVRALLSTVSDAQPNARISVRDASFLYELEMRDGAPRSATRTTTDGAFQRGRDVFAALLGVRAGRFVVVPATGSVRGELEGSLAQQMERPIAMARAAMRVLGGTRLLEVQRVGVAIERVEAYLSATPDPARSLVRRLADGASPRSMILSGEAAPRLLEDVLADLASHAAIDTVEGPQLVDLLGPALEAELASLRRGITPSLQPPPAPAPIAPRLAAEPVHAAGAPPQGIAAELLSLADLPDAGPIAAADVPELAPTPSPRPTSPLVPRAAVSVVAPVSSIDAAPSSLEDAVIRELSERTPDPGSSAAKASATPASTMIDARALRARSFTPAAGIEAVPMPASSPSLPGGSPSLPPDAIVPASESDSLVPSIPPAKPEVARETPPAVPVEPAIVAPTPRTSGAEPKPARAPLPAPTPPAPRVVIAEQEPADEPSPSRSLPPPAQRRLTWLAAAVIAAAAVAFGVRWSQEEHAGPRPAPEPSSTPVAAPSMPAAPAPTAAATPAPDAAPLDVAASVDAGAPSPASSTAPAGEDMPLPNGARIAAGQGLLELETGGRDTVYIDSQEMGRGPVLRLALSPGVHEVRVKAHGEERVRFVVIRAARRTRLPLLSPWRR